MQAANRGAVEVSERERSSPLSARRAVAAAEASASPLRRLGAEVAIAFAVKLLAILALFFLFFDSGRDLGATAPTRAAILGPASPTR